MKVPNPTDRQNQEMVHLDLAMEHGLKSPIGLPDLIVKHSAEETPEEESHTGRNLAMAGAAAPNEDHKWRNRLLTSGAALGAGLGAYKFLRAPKFSTSPALAKLQRIGATKGFHPTVEALHPSDPHADSPL